MLLGVPHYYGMCRDVSPESPRTNGYRKTANSMPNIESTRSTIVLVLALAAFSIAVSFQGWRSRLLTSDLWIAAKSAESFIASGKLPDHGCLSSYRSYIPPGTNLFIIPGVLLFSDQRLYELPGAALLHLGTIIGLFLLCRLYFSTRCAYLSVVLYSVSALGVLFATSLWPRGHPFFTVWFFYFLGDWNVRNNRYALGWALFTWGLGMLYFMELAPLLVAVPIVYFASRPRICKKAVALSIIVSVLVWSPYILFESHRGYRDLLSLISRTPLQAPDSIDGAGSHPLLDARTDQRFIVRRPNGGLLMTVALKSAGLVNALLSNFTENTTVPGSAGALLALCAMGLTLAAPQLWKRLPPLWRVVLAVTLSGASVACLSASTLVRLALHRPLQAEISAYTSCMGANLLVFLLVVLVMSSLRPAIAASSGRSGEVAGNRELMLFALCFAAAWGAIAILSNGLTTGRRLWWAWPLHIVFVAFFLTSLSRRVALPMTLLVLGMLTFNHATFDRVYDCWNNGWSGKDHGVLRLLDTLASLEKRSDVLSIGYVIAFPSWFPDFQQIDGDYKVGTDFDLYLRKHHGIKSVSDRGDDGIGIGNKYLIVQKDLKHTAGVDSVYPSGVPLGGYVELQCSREYSLFRRKGF